MFKKSISFFALILLLVLLVSLTACDNGGNPETDRVTNIDKNEHVDVRGDCHAADGGYVRCHVPSAVNPSEVWIFPPGSRYKIQD